MYRRCLNSELIFSVENFPVTAIVGPRQCGKSTLANHLLEHYPESIYLDLERPSDLKKLDNAELFLTSQRGKLICLDEVQRKPELFPLIRSLVDEWGTSGCFLVLGSASRDLLKQSSETLAGRIAYHTLTPFLWPEINVDHSLNDYFVLGGFPRSILASSAKASMVWRNNFIQTFLERDLQQWVGFLPETMRRLWQMLAHLNGQQVNYTTLSNSLGISAPTVKRYVDLLAGTFMVDVVPPYHSNLGKRLVKSPKVYVADSGITTALLNIASFEDLVGHPAFGAIWEQMVLSNMRGLFGDAGICHYRTSNGTEIDFVVKAGRKTFAIECKVSLSPTLSRGNHNAIADIAPDHTFVVIPTAEGWPIDRGIDAVSLGELPRRINEALR